MAAQNEYLSKQLGESLKNKRRELRSSSSSRPPRSARGEEEEKEPHSHGSSSEDASPRTQRRRRRHSSNFNDFKVDISEFEGKLDPDDFIEWLQTVERIFDYKEIPKDKKVKIMALKLRKYASLWWTNLLTKSVRQGKGRIRTWENKNQIKGLVLTT